MMQKLTICDTADGELTVFAEKVVWSEDGLPPEIMVCQIETFYDGNTCILTISAADDMAALIKRLTEIGTQMHNEQ